MRAKRAAADSKPWLVGLSPAAVVFDRTLLVRSQHIILIFRSHVVPQLMNEHFWLTIKSAPDSAGRGLAGAVDRDANQAEPAVQFLRIGLGAPPRRARRFAAGRRIVEADRIVHDVAMNPGARSDVVGKVRGIVTHTANLRFRQRPGSARHLVTIERVSPLTLTFSGAANGLTSNHMNCASRPPLQRAELLCCVRQLHKPVTITIFPQANNLDIFGALDVLGPNSYVGIEMRVRSQEREAVSIAVARRCVWSGHRIFGGLHGSTLASTNHKNIVEFDMTRL